MTSTSPLYVPVDPVVPSAPSLSLVRRPRLALAAAQRSAEPAPAPVPAPRAVAAPSNPADIAAPTPSRPRFRRLVVFTGQLS